MCRRCASSVRGHRRFAAVLLIAGRFEHRRGDRVSIVAIGERQRWIHLAADDARVSSSGIDCSRRSSLT